MKKIISGFIILIMALTLASVSLKTVSKAMEINEDKTSKTTIVFDKAFFGKMSNNETFKLKMEELKVSSNLYKIISLQMYDDICKANEVIIENSYYIELDDGSLMQTTKEKYLTQVKENKKYIQEMNQYMKNKLSNKVSLYTTIGSSGNTEKINNGTLNLAIILITDDNISYSCGCLFNWETMPLARHKDAIGLSRDGNVSFEPKSACGTVIYSYDYSYLSSKEYVKEKIDEVKQIPFNQMKSSTTGYAFDFKLGEDSAGQNYPYYNVSYTGMTGSVYYKGEVNNKSITSVNHWATYAHKNLGLSIDDIDFSIPFEKKFSIKLAWRYTQLREEHLWRRK